MSIKPINENLAKAGRFLTAWQYQPTAIILILLIILSAVSLVSAANTQSTVSQLNGKATDYEFFPVSNQVLRANQPLPQKRANIREDSLWTLSHVDDVMEYWLGSGAAGDTFALCLHRPPIVLCEKLRCSGTVRVMSWLSPQNTVILPVR